MSQVKAHFEAEAPLFDQLILQLIPQYAEMFEALAGLLPFTPDQSPRLLDLGCGTGTLALGIKRRFPLAQLTLVDLAAPMVEAAQKKLAGFDGVDCWVLDFGTEPIPGPQDAVVSSLALHHLETDEHKRQIYRAIFEALAPGGVFYNIDVVLAPSERLQSIYMERWRQFMAQSHPLEEVDGTWLRKHHQEDRPAVLMDQLDWLKEIGFEEVEVVDKQFNFALYGGRKPVG